MEVISLIIGSDSITIYDGKNCSMRLDAAAPPPNHLSSVESREDVKAEGQASRPRVKGTDLLRNFFRCKHK